MEMSKSKNKKKVNGNGTIPILLCGGSQGRAVVYGRVESEPVAGRPVRLVGARMVLYWAQACGGLFGLAARGPRSDTRLTATVQEVTDTDWRQWLRVSEEAAKALDEWPV